MGIRQEAKRQSRQKIIDAMEALLREKKADRISIEEITTRAGIGKGSFYTHFKRKEDVISVLAMERYNAVMENALQLTGGTCQRIGEYLTRSAEIIDEHTLQIAQNWMKSVTAPLEGEHGGSDKFHFDWDNLSRLLADGAARGEYRPDIPVEALTGMIMNAYYGAVANWCITNGEADLLSGIAAFCNYGLPAMLNQFKSGGNGQ